VIDLAAKRRITSVKLANWLYAGAGTNCLPDLRVDARGGAIVTDNVQPKLWRINAEDASADERSVKFDSRTMIDAGFSALAIADDGTLFGAIAAPGTLWRIDSRDWRARKVALSAPLHGACALEILGAARSKNPMLFVLAAGRSAFDVRRIDMTRSAKANVIALGSVAAPAGLLASRGMIHLAVPGLRDDERHGHLQADARSFALKTIYRLD
jgi:hypothetical protein